MRRRITAAILFAISVSLVGCSSSNDSHSAPSSAQKLADLDGGSHLVGQYQQALNTWGSRCNEDSAALAGYVYATVQDLQKNGIHETEYSALTHLRDSTPVGVKTQCADVAAAYPTSRESGQVVTR
ncbi:hypothetical protein [Streptomyces sp. NPDC053069]|uniref:hypothetical protein n=1 Tax=Streptomyces sp. NPDC053069 TaxID=3365695 RepID=UPI0037D08049